nr:unnamed protein product [Callosobruchus chinensis]
MAAQKYYKLIFIGGVSVGSFLAGSYVEKNKIKDKLLTCGVPIFTTVSAATAFSPAVTPESNVSRVSEIMKYGFPGMDNVRSFDDFVLSYDRRNRVAHWVFEHLTAEKVKRNDDVDRSKCDFKPDESIHPFFRSLNSDYKGSGYDRGHLAAAGNHKYCQKHIEQTFYLSNMAPQVGMEKRSWTYKELENLTQNEIYNILEDIPSDNESNASDIQSVMADNIDIDDIRENEIVCDIEGEILAQADDLIQWDSKDELPLSALVSNEVFWTTDEGYVRRPQSFNENTGPNIPDDAETPVDIFLQLFPDDLTKNIRYLIVDGIYASGTERKGRKYYPALKADKEMNRGHIDFRISTDRQAALKWMDKRSVLFLANYQNPKVIERVPRKSKSVVVEKVTCPRMVVCVCVVNAFIIIIPAEKKVEKPFYEIFPKEADGKNYVKYEVIGANHVAVPTHFYKVIVGETKDGKLEMEAFVMPNQVIDGTVPLTSFQVPPESIERAAGLLFFDNVARNKFSKINGKKI